LTIPRLRQEADGVAKLPALELDDVVTDPGGLSRQTALEIIQIHASRSVKGSLAKRSLVQMERETEKLPPLLLSCMFTSDPFLVR
jgi:hypothetical protein